MKLLRPDPHMLAGAYALDALRGAEQDRFTRHLQRCQACADEVRRLREVATAMAFAATTEPPDALRGRVLTVAARTQQLPAEVPRLQPRRRSLVPRLAAAAAAAAITAAAVLGVVQVNTERQLDQARAQSQAIAAVLAAPDARILARSTTAGGIATVVLSAARRELIVTTAGLPPLPASKVYELWLMGPPGTRPAGLLPAATAGRAGPVLASGVISGDKLGLTVEPAGGTAQPTTTPIMMLALPS
jgi:hypothetical protein